MGCLYRIDGENVEFGERQYSSEQTRASYPFSGFLASEIAPDVRMAAFGARQPCSTARRIATKVTGGGPRLTALLGFLTAAGVTDALGIVGVDPSGYGALLTSPSPTEIRWPEAKLEMWARVSIHISTALRLRRAWRVAQEQPVAVLDENARVLHTENSNATYRELLRQSARIVLRAASPDRDAAATMIAWRALVAGELSLVDTFDTDGKRLIIARRNRPSGMTVANDPLSERERRVVEYARLGHPNKLIAYALGISASTVSTHLRSACRKLGAPNRIALIAASDGVRDATQPIEARERAEAHPRGLDIKS